MNISPRNKISKANKHSRHSTWKTINLKKLTKKYQTTTCPNCGANMLTHRVCPVCGYYNGKQVVTVKAKSNDWIIEA